MDQEISMILDGLKYTQGDPSAHLTNPDIPYRPSTGINSILLEPSCR